MSWSSADIMIIEESEGDARKSLLISNLECGERKESLPCCWLNVRLTY